MNYPLPITIDKYQIINKIGSGQYGLVLHVLDRALQAEKAIKILDLADPKRFMEKLEEAQILHKCRHKNIVEINEANIFDVSGQPKVILDLEYVSHGSLEKAMLNRYIPISESVKHMIDVLSGLEYAHSQGFLHRDIKPGNILIGDSISKLSDFGLATSYSVNSCCSPQGYITHLAPEFYTTNSTTKLTDIFAAGMTFYRIVENISNWRALTQNLPKLQDHIRKGRLISQIGFSKYTPQPIKRIINKACNPDPVKRFQTAHEMSQSLSKLRFNISWVKIDDTHWSGISGNDLYSLECNNSKNKYKIDLLKNKRRQQNNCTSCNDFQEAMNIIHDIVAETTLC